MYRIIAYDEPTDKAGFDVLNPRINRHILAGRLTLKEQDIDDLELTVNQDNPLFDRVKPMHTHIEVYDNDHLIFRGRAIKPQREMDSDGRFTRHYIFEDIEAYLLDSNQRFYTAVGQTPQNFLKTLIDVHNDQVPDYKKFEVRDVDVGDSADDEYRQMDYPKTRDAIKQYLLERIGGYLTVEYNKDGINHLDYTKTNGKEHKSDTPIEIGLNMKSAKLAIDPTKVITRVIPLGATVETGDVELGDDGITETSVIPGQPGVTAAVNGDWTEAIKNAARVSGVAMNDAQLNVLKAQIRLESGGNDKALGGTDGLADGRATGLLQFKPATFNYYCRPPFNNIWQGWDQLLAFFNIPNCFNQINGYTGWSPHGAPISKDPLTVTSSTETVTSKTTNPWGWPFPGAGDRPFSQAQSFGWDGGYRQNGFHDGLDFGSNTHPGNPIHAIHGGTVIIKSYMSGLGNYLVTHSKDGYNIVYQEAFASSGDIWKSVGDVIKTGDEIGRRTTDHLHVGVTKADFYQAVRKSFTNDGTWLDPKALILSGGTEEDKESTSTNYKVSNDAPKPRTTIASVNDGKDYIDIPELQKEFGIINGAVQFDDVTDPSQLFKAAKAWISSQNAATYTWDISALELPQFDSFKVGDSYTFLNEIVAKPQLLKIVEKQIDLVHPYESQLTIGEQQVSLTDYQVEQQRNIEARLKAVTRRVRQQGTTIINNVNGAQGIQQSFNNFTENNSKELQSLKHQVDSVQSTINNFGETYVSAKDYNDLLKRVEELEKGSDTSGS